MSWVHMLTLPQNEFVEIIPRSLRLKTSRTEGIKQYLIDMVGSTGYTTRGSQVCGFPSWYDPIDDTLEPLII